jgi:hypothetical protein
MSSHENFSPRKTVLITAILPGVLFACSGGNGFSSQGSPDGSVPATSDDSDGGVVVVVSPNADAMSATDTSVDAGTNLAMDAESADVGPDVGPEADAAPDAPSCSASELDCAGVCVPIDTTNCGACGTMCASPAGGTVSCAEASGAYSCAVSCNANLTHCGGACVDVQTDASNCGRCGHGCVGGTCVTGQCQSWVVTNTSAANALMVTPRGALLGAAGMVTDGTNVIWLDTTQGLLEVSATAGASTPVVNLAPFQNSGGVSLEGLAMANGVIVWTTSDAANGVSLSSATEGAPNSGAPVVSLGSGTASDILTGLALDATGSNAYFLDLESNSAGPPHAPGLFKCNLASKSCTHEYNVTVPTALLPGNDVAVAGSRLFWTDSQSGNIFRADYSVNSEGAVVTDPSGPSLLALDATYVYWANVTPANSSAGTSGSFSIARTSQASPGSVSPVVSTMGGGVWGIGTDGTNVYFIGGNQGVGLLDYAPVDGSSASNPRSLKAGQTPYGMAVGGGAIYWMNSDNTIDGIATP